MEIGPDRPENGLTDDLPATDSSTVRRLVIVAGACLLGLAAAWAGFTLEEQGKWPFGDETPSARIVLD